VRSLPAPGLAPGAALVFLSMATILPTTATAQDCWVDVGKKGTYGSYEQGQELRTLVQNVLIRKRNHAKAWQLYA
jgi:hypothetical protein